MNLSKISLLSSAYLSFRIKSKLLILFRCTHKLDNNLTSFHFTCNNGSFIYYNHPDDDLPSTLPPICSLIQLPVHKTRKSNDLFHSFEGSIYLSLIGERNFRFLSNRLPLFNFSLCFSFILLTKVK